MSKITPNAEQLVALAEFARIYGRRWKSQLIHFWISGWDDDYSPAYVSHLQWLRDAGFDPHTFYFKKLTRIEA